MRPILFFFLFFILSYKTNGQIILGPEGEKLIKSPFQVVDQGWEHRGAVSLNSTQTYLSNWASGGNSAFNLTGLLNYSFFYRDNRHSWDNIIKAAYRDWETDRKSTRLNSSHLKLSRMPSSA